VDELNACSNRRTYVEDKRRVDDEVRTLLDQESMYRPISLYCCIMIIVLLVLSPYLLLF